MLDIERIVKTRVARTAANVIQENYDKIINRLKPFQGYIDSTVNKIQNVDSKVAAAEAKAQTYFKDVTSHLLSYIFLILIPRMFSTQ